MVIKFNYKILLNEIKLPPLKFKENIKVFYLNLLMILLKLNLMGIGDWGWGIGDWGLGIGPNPQSPIPNPQ